MAEKMKKRSEIDARWKWDLTPIFASDKAWEEAARAIQPRFAAFAALKGHVAEDPAQAIRTYFELVEDMSALYEYGFLRLDTDSGDAAAQSLKERATALYVKGETAAAFLEPELLMLPDEQLAAMQQDPALADYSEYLRGLTREKSHMLPVEQELLLAAAQPLAMAPDKIFSMLTDVDMKFPDVTMPDGDTAQLTEGNYSIFSHGKDRGVRRQAFLNIMNTYASFGSTIAATYGASVQKDHILASLRHYASCRNAQMDPLQIPVSVYDNLVHNVSDAIPALTEYLKLRKQIMGLDELHMYDLYAPMVQDFEMKLSYPEAFALVLEGLAPLGEDYVSHLKEAYENGWIDVYPNENKASGAFSLGELRKAHPYVKLNHVDNLSSASTIAHELGHAMHSFYSNQAQPYAKSDYSLFVAEVASTCNEAIMFQYLLGKFTDKKARAYLLNDLMERFRQTVYRQTMFAEFELISHDLAERDEPLTREALSNAYLALNRKYYGDACVVDEEIAAEWMRIPHFYRPFYVYVYATGFCAAMYLSRRILKEGAPAVADYRKFLSAGSSMPPLEALKLAGVDMSRPEPVIDAMRSFQETIEEFRALMDA